MACSNRPSVSTRICRFLPLISLPASTPVRIDAGSPFFGALDALAIDDAGGGTGFSVRLLAAFGVERVMNAIQRAVAVPPDEVVVDRAAGWKIFRKVAPLAAGAQDIHDPVHHRAQICSPLAAAAPRWRNEPLDKRPLLIRQVARIAQIITIVSSLGSHPSTSAASPRIRTAFLESQPIQPIQQVLGRTLSLSISATR